MSRVKVQRIQHVLVSIPVGSEVEARAFYCGLLGLVEIEKPPELRARGGFWVEVGDQEIHFGAEDVADRAASRRHVGLVVVDLAAARRALEEAGVVVPPSTTLPGWDRFEVRDPFGNRLELLQRRAD